jgi:tRNA A37 threonylcarbamoyladenosine dehydratase
MNALVTPLPLFRRILAQLREAPRSAFQCRVGMCRTRSEVVWLARDFTLLPAGSMSDPRSEQVIYIGSLAVEPPPDWRMLVSQLPASVVGAVLIGDGNLRGHVWGAIHTPEGIEPLQRLSLVGAGMHEISIADRGLYSADWEADMSDWERERWSRTIGALGGEDIWQRLVQLRIALIGCGRTGSLVAVTLARLGVRELSLIDPDVVEEHNLGEMDAVTEADLGLPKAEAVAVHLQTIATSATEFIPIPSLVTADSALAACKEADVLFCCADNDAARLATAILATLYHKVLVDIGTGIHFTTSDTQIRNPQTTIRNRIMGADIRRILPGDGCLLCRGNLANYAQAVEDLCNHRPPGGRHGEWNQHRAGSLRSVNQLAAGLGVQMLQDLVAERIQQSVWARLEFDQAGQATEEKIERVQRLLDDFKKRLRATFTFNETQAQINRLTD